MLSKIEMEVENMERETLSNRLRTAYWSLVAVGCGLMLSVRPVLAETIWDRFSSIMQDIYGQVVAISTIVAVTVAAIALIVRMVSRNQRAVDEATSWLKRIVVTWIVLNTPGVHRGLPAAPDRWWPVHRRLKEVSNARLDF